MAKRRNEIEAKIAKLYSFVEANPEIAAFRVEPGEEPLVTLYRRIEAVGNKSCSVVSMGTFPLDDALQFVILEIENGF